MKAQQIKQQARATVKSALQENPYTYKNENGDSVKSVFLGTVFGIMPSGKYYMPFACSNVDSCPRCKGEGQTKSLKHCTYCDGMGNREAYEDSLMADYLEYYANKQNGWIESGDGDPCDLFVCWNDDN